MCDKFSATELRELLSSLCDGQISTKEYRRLEELLASDPAARKLYYDYMALHADLTWGNAAGESKETLMGIEASRAQKDGSSFSTQNSPILGFLGESFDQGFGMLSENKGLWGILLLATAAVSLLGFAFFGPWGGAEQLADKNDQLTVEQPAICATIVEAVDCKWVENTKSFDNASELGYGDTLKLESGLAKIAFTDRAEVILEGPAEFYVESPMSARLVSGRLSAKVTDAGHGFTIYGPSMRVLDLGTEFGLCINEEGKGQVHVFKGEVDVALTRHDGQTLRSQLLTQHKAVAIDSQDCQITDVQFDPARFIRTFEPSDLDITREYVQAVKSLQPIAYWRFEYFIDNDRVPNEMSDHYHGSSPTRLVLSPDTQNKTLSVDQRRDDRQYMTIDEPIVELVDSDMSFEFWIKPDEPQWTTPVMLFYPMGSQDPKDREPVTRLVEFLPAGRPHHNQDANLIRLLHRFPPCWDFEKGTNIYSPIEYQPGKWHHIVGTYSGTEMRLFLNGQEVASAPIADRLEKPPLLSIGRTQCCIDPDYRLVNKEMVGQIDEVAIYNQALTPEQVAEHYQLGKHQEAQ